MRAALLALGLPLTAIATAQTSGNLFVTTRPDVSIVVRKHRTGADVVEVTMPDPKYPRELLRQQVDAIGRYVGSAPTGLQLDVHQIGNDANLRFARAFFAVNGLIDRASGVLRVEPLAKAFAGAPDPYTIDVLMIRFEGERPTQNTLQGYYPETGELRLQALASSRELGVEYRVQLLTQDPEKIRIPDDRRRPVAPKAVPPAKPPAGPDWVLIGVLAAAALAVGALVYSLLLRARPRDSRAGRA
jgi:hypothetical protein